MSRGTLVPATSLQFSSTGLLPSLAELSNSIRLTFVNGYCRPATPKVRRLLVWACPRSLAATDGIIRYFLFLRLLRCFSSPGSLPYTMYSCMGNQTLLWLGFPIRKSMDRCLLAAPHSLSQLTTSFIGS